MKIRNILSIVLMMSSCQLAPAQDLNVREFRRVVEVGDVTTADRMPWYAGESVGYTVVAQREGEPVQIPDGSVPVWLVLDAATNAYVVSTGSVVSATNGEVRFWLPAPEANLPSGNYLSYATVYQGTNRIGVLDRTTVRVSWRPGDSFDSVKPITNVLDQVTAWWADANANLASASNFLSGAIAAEIQAREDAGYITSETDAAGLAAAAGVQSNLAAHASRTDNPHQVTPAQIGAATGTPVYAEQDPAALAALSAMPTGNWNTAVSWGNHASAGYALGSALASYLSKAQAETQYVTTAVASNWETGTHEGLVSTSHSGNVSITGILSANTNGFHPIIGRERFVPAFNSSSGGVYVASPARAISATATSYPAASLAGYDVREFGRACVWINSYMYKGEGTNFDGQADIYFGVSNSFLDTDIDWTISSRPNIHRSWGHDTDGELAFFEGYHAGDPSIGGKRFAIYHDRNGQHGSVLFANDDNPDAPLPVDNCTMTIRSTVRDESTYLETSTNAHTLLKSRLHFKSGTNDLAMWMVGSNGYFAITMNGLQNEPLLSISNGIVRIPSLEQSAAGIDASEAGQIATNVAGGYVPLYSGDSYTRWEFDSVDGVERLNWGTNQVSEVREVDFTTGSIDGPWNFGQMPSAQSVPMLNVNSSLNAANLTNVLPAGVLGTSVSRTVGGLNTTGTVAAAAMTVNGAAVLTATGESPCEVIGYATNVVLSSANLPVKYLVSTSGPTTVWMPTKTSLTNACTVWLSLFSGASQVVFTNGASGLNLGSISLSTTATNQLMFYSPPMTSNYWGKQL